MKAAIARALTFALFSQVYLSGCAHTQSTGFRIAVGAGIGAGAGAMSGTVLSPNDESKGMNALVFGAVGALAGGLIAYLTDNSKLNEKAEGDFRKAEGAGLEMKRDTAGSEYVVPLKTDLPLFVKERLTPVVIEEYLQKDQLNEDGSISEPHKVYRIKRNAELVTKDQETNSQNAAGPKQ